MNTFIKLEDLIRTAIALYIWSVKNSRWSAIEQRVNIPLATSIGDQKKKQAMCHSCRYVGGGGCHRSRVTRDFFPFRAIRSIWEWGEACPIAAVPDGHLFRSRFRFLTAARDAIKIWTVKKRLCTWLKKFVNIQINYFYLYFSNMN